LQQRLLHMTRWNICKSRCIYISLSLCVCHKRQKPVLAIAWKCNACQDDALLWHFVDLSFRSLRLSLQPSKIYEKRFLIRIDTYEVWRLKSMTLSRSIHTLLVAFFSSQPTLYPSEICSHPAIQKKFVGVIFTYIAVVKMPSLFSFFDLPSWDYNM
jgi:hypothetical protein